MVYLLARGFKFHLLGYRGVLKTWSHEKSISSTKQTAEELLSLAAISGRIYPWRSDKVYDFTFAAVVSVFMSTHPYVRDVLLRSLVTVYH